jgi:formylglycine-generating enzyme required for sulfatase activity
MLRKVMFALLLALLGLVVLLPACAGDDDDDDAADDDNDDGDDDDDDDNDTTDDDDATPDEDFVLDGVLITSAETDAAGYVSFDLEGQGVLGFFVKDEGELDDPIAGVRVFLIVKEATAAVLALDAAGAYLPFLSAVADLAPAPTGKAAGDLDFFLGLPRSQSAGPNEPLVIGAQIPADLLRVMLVFFFEEWGDTTLAQLDDSVAGLLPGEGSGKIAQFAVLENLATATGDVAVTLAVFDASHPDIAGFFASLYAAQCFQNADAFTLYRRDEPLADNAPGSYQFLLAAPQVDSTPAQTFTLRVTVTDAMDTLPVAAARLALAPTGLVGFTGTDGVYSFANVGMCDSDPAPTYFLRASRFGFYPAQYDLTGLVAAQTNEFHVTLSPLGTGPEDPTWMSIPGGTFAMGCSPSDDLCDADELPAHNVTISAFDLTATEITQRQYYKLTGANPAWYDDCLDCPLELVTWQEAGDACVLLGGRLPTEAEWEYAARAGSTTRYHCGDDAACLDAVAWDIYNAGSRTRPAGQKAANAWGLYDMHGNVWELTADWYGGSYYGVSPATDPTGPATGEYNVKRGGSWYSGFDNNRISNRFAGDVGGRYANLGFRCAR